MALLKLAFLVKDCTNILAKLQSVMFNPILKVVTFPGSWKLHKTIPVLERIAYCFSIENYRLIPAITLFLK
jgi:hypothetical protein